MDKLIEIAKKSMENSYAPYSNYHVGVALVTKTNKVYSGCNIENHGIMSICAERVAFTKAISEGEKEFKYMVLCGGKDINNLDECIPCGYCRQFMSEFVDDDFIIYVIDKNNNLIPHKLKELLPLCFEL